MRSLDLFSCVGCHAIGFERAGIETVAFCEKNEFRRAILKRHFPGIEVHYDVCTITAPLADIVIGGPPCQRTSVASAISGNRSGESLWRFMRSICNAVRPQWIVVEQPPGNAEWETKVADDLCVLGYHNSRIEFAACDVGAPYPRRRVFILASPSLPRLEVAWRSVAPAIESVKRSANARTEWDADKLGALRVDARSAGEMDKSRSRERKERIEALGDSNPPHMAEVIGRAIMCAEVL